MQSGKTSKQEKKKKSSQEDDKPFLFIRLDQLEKDWVKQPKLADRWHTKLAKAREALEIAEAEFELCQARLDADIRQSPDSYDLPKATEKSIANCLIMQPVYQMAQKTVIEARAKVNMIQATTIALDHKKKGLEKTVDLFGMNYFSVPRASERSREVADKMEKRAIRSRGREDD